MKKVIFFAFLLLLVPALAIGQAQRTGKVNVKVWDEDGNPVAGALITVDSPAMLGTREARTDENGTYTFGLLPIGSYRVVVTAPNKKSLDFSFPLLLGQTIPLHSVMEAGQDITEEVVVRGTVSAMQTTSNGENFDFAETVEELPIQARDLENIASYAPNVAAGPTNRTLQISGANSFDTVVLLDGAELSDPFFGSAPVLYVEDAIQELQVLTSGISARYGRFGGGVLNAISKTGGNEFDGSVRVEFDQEDWNEQTPFDESAGTPQSDDLNKTYFGSLGGYVVKDHLWFFASIWDRPPDDDIRSTVGGGGVPVESFSVSSEQERKQIKLRGAINPNHVLEGSWLDFEQSTNPWAAGSIGSGEPRAVGVRDDPRELLTFTYQGVMTPNLFLDLQATDKDVNIIAGGDPAKGSPFFDFWNFRFLNNMWWDATDPDIRSNETASANLTYTFSAGSTTHSLEGGLQIIESTTGGDNRQSSTGFNLLCLCPDFTSGVDGMGNILYNLYPGQTSWQEMWQALPLGAEAVIDYTGAYVQDTIEFGKWRFDIGFRYEEYDGMGPLDIQTANFDGIVPRAGITYNIDQNWQLQFTYGKYLARFNDGIAGEAAGVSSAPRITYDSYIGPPLMGVTGDVVDAAMRDPANWNAVVGFQSPEFPVVIMSPDVESPETQEVTFAIKRALPGNSGVVSLTVVDRDYRQLVDDRVGQQIAGGTPSLQIPVDFMGMNFGTFDQIVWDNAPFAERRYTSAAVVFDYRPSSTWNIGGSYTYAELRGNYTGEGTNQPASGSDIGDYPVTVPSLAVFNPSGRLPGDVTHRARVWGNYRFDFERAGNLNLGGILRFTDGDVYGYNDDVRRPIDDSTALNDNGTTYTHWFSERGQFRFPSSYAFDLSARYQVPIWRDLSAWVKLNVLNVLNLDKLVSFETDVSANRFNIPYFNEMGMPVDANMDGTQDTCSLCGVSGFDFDPDFGEANESADYQTPRTYLVTVGLAW